MHADTDCETALVDGGWLSVVSEGGVEVVAPTAEPRATLSLREQGLAALIRRVGQGDHSALAALFDETSSFVYGLALKVLRDPSTAEEVTLDVYMQAYRTAPSYDPSRGTPSAWLVTLARSRAIDRLRSESRKLSRQKPVQMAEALADSGADPEEHGALAERQRVVQSALAALTPEQREVIEIAYYAELTHTEIAAKLQLPLGTVKTRLRTGMMRLCALLPPSFAETWS